jgi:DNA mismatch repair protein MutS
MMRQWRDLRALAGDSLLFFRLGDFYELFEEDALVAAPLMGVALTSRNSKGKDAPALCGVPVAHLEMYLNRLLNAGKSVALAEQTELPQPGKNLVRREIVQWFTPGIRWFDHATGEARESETPMLACVSGTARSWAVAAADVSSGHCVVETGSDLDALADFCENWGVQDLRATPEISRELRVGFTRPRLEIPAARHQETILKALSLHDWQDCSVLKPLEQSALASLIQVLAEAHPKRSIRLHPPGQEAHRVWMNAATRRHLHLFEPRENSVLSFLDHCQTARGRRLLRERLLSPTNDLEEILRRRRLVNIFKEKSLGRKRFREELKAILDLDRLFRRSRGAPHLWSIQQSLRAASLAVDALPDADLQETAHPLRSAWLPFLDLLESKIQKSESTDQGWVRDGVLHELDELRDLKRNTQSHIEKTETRLREQFGISTLKLKLHQVFGLVAEVSALHQSKIAGQADLRLIQTLAHAHRFKTPELESLEKDLLSAETRILQLEQSVIEECFEKLEEYKSAIEKFLSQIAELDVSQALAEVSLRYRWSTAKISNSPQCRLVNAVHPLVKEDFVPLSFSLDSQGCRVMLLTGPNMAGKSTVMRVAALCALLNQVGSDVPAESAELSLFNRIGCRMGSGDDLISGKSTFYLEVRELSSLVRGADGRSLLLLDEIGRGTSTYDGMSLAWAITEHIHQSHCLAIVATHYLELAELANSCSQLENYHLGVEEKAGQLLFTRALRPGAASRSYGLQVAKLAELPAEILESAQKKLEELETQKGLAPASGNSSHTGRSQKRNSSSKSNDSPQNNLFEWRGRHAPPSL